MPDKTNVKLKQLLRPGAAVAVPGAFSALAARVIEGCGFEAVYVTGAGVTNNYLGAPDIGLITLTELADNVAAMRDAVALPLIVDADTGFGNAINVGRTIKVLERAGASAIQLEDQIFPKRCGHFEGKTVIAPEEMVQKIRAAVDARTNRDLVIIARTDAIAVNGIDDALDRAHRYLDAGADVTFVEAPLSVEQMAQICRSIECPQILNVVAGGLTPAIDVDKARDLGFAMVLYANAALQAAMLAMQNVLSELHRSGSLATSKHLLIDFLKRQELVGKPAYDRLEKQYSIARGGDRS